MLVFLFSSIFDREMEGTQTIKIYSDNEFKKCLVCKCEPVNITFVPCKHQVLCSGCVIQKGKFFTHCPLCGRFVEGNFRSNCLQDNRVLLIKHVLEPKCIICEDAVATLTFRPCKHRLLCVGCYATRQFSLLFCIQCRKPIDKADNCDYTKDPQEQAFFNNENYSVYV